MWSHVKQARQYWFEDGASIVQQCFMTLSLAAEDNQPYLSLPCSEHKITSAVWGPLGDFVIAGHENGEINQFSAKVGGNGNVVYWLNIQ